MFQHPVLLFHAAKAAIEQRLFRLSLLYLYVRAKSSPVGCCNASVDFLPETFAHKRKTPARSWTGIALLAGRDSNPQALADNRISSEVPRAEIDGS